jgi:hypothetical protein
VTCAPYRSLLLEVDSAMTAKAPFALPGYEWDGTRFYKSLPGAGAVFKPAHPLPPPEPAAAGRQRKKARRAQDKGKAKAVEPSMSGLRSMFDAQLSLGGSRSRMHQRALLLSSIFAFEADSFAVISSRCPWDDYNPPGPSTPTAYPWTSRSESSPSTSSIPP